MDQESPDLFRFDLWPVLQGHMRVAEVNFAMWKQPIENHGLGIFWGFRFDLGTLLQGHTRIAKLKSAYNSLIIPARIFGMWNQHIGNQGLEIWYGLIWPLTPLSRSNGGSLTSVNCVSYGLADWHQLQSNPVQVVLYHPVQFQTWMLKGRYKDTHTHQRISISKAT